MTVTPTSRKLQARNTPDMDVLQGITQQINVFVRFFESINYLFCQIRWLEQNVQNSSNSLLIIVGSIGLLCFFIYYNSTIDWGDKDNLIANLFRIVVAYFPIVTVVLLLAYLFIRRFSNSASAELEELGGGHGVGEVLLGSQRSTAGGIGQRSDRPHDRDIESHLLPKARLSGGYR